MIGEKFLTKEDVTNFISRLETSPPVYIYHLSVSFNTREKRLHQRGPHSLIDLEKDEKDRDAVRNLTPLASASAVYNSIRKLI